MAASKGPSTRVNFNIGVTGEAGSGRQTFIKSLVDGYDNDKHDFRIRIIGKKFLSQASLMKRHMDWLDGYGIPVSEEVLNASDRRVHCIFYLFSPHRVLSSHKRRIAALSGLAPIIPIVSKADMLTAEERAHQLQEVHSLMTEVTEDSAYPTFFDFGETATVPPVLKVDLPACSAASEGDQEEHKNTGEEEEEDERTPQNPANTPTSAADESGESSESSESGVLVGLSDLFGEEQDSPLNQPTDIAENTDTTSTAAAAPPAVVGGVGGDSSALPSSSSPAPLFNESLTQLQAHLSRVVPLVTRAAVQAKKRKQAAQSRLAHTSLPTSLPTSLFNSHSTTHPTQSDTPSVRNIFAVVCADPASGLRVYPWGSATPRDETVSDLPRLQRLIFEQGNINKLRALTQEFSIRLHHERCREQGMMDVQTRHKIEERRDWQMKLFVGFVFACMVVMYGVNLAVLGKVLNQQTSTRTIVHHTIANHTANHNITIVNATITASVQQVPEPVTHALPVGTHVQSDRHGRGFWYTGRVAAVHTDGTVDVEYSDGEREAFVPGQRVRRR